MGDEPSFRERTMVNWLLAFQLFDCEPIWLVENEAWFRNLKFLFGGPCVLACLKPTRVIPAPKKLSHKMFDVLKRTGDKQQRLMGGLWGPEIRDETR
jgi:hypothetical protein